MATRAILSLLSAVALAGCTTAEEPVEPIERMPGEDTPCVAERVQQYVGQKTSAEIGQAIIEATGAGIFQWVPPDSAVTMDYRPDRVRVSYDRNMVITAIRCG